MALPYSDDEVRMIFGKQPPFIWFKTAENVFIYVADKFILKLT